MKSIFISRILWIIPIVLISSFVAFCLLRLGGSDPVMSYILQSNLPATPELINELKAEFGLDKSLLTQYALWLKDAIRLDFGTSYMTGRSVSEDFLHFLPTTLMLVCCGFVLSFACSLLLGILSAYYHNRLLDSCDKDFLLCGCEYAKLLACLFACAVF